jgi:hypothetical protein
MKSLTKLSIGIITAVSLSIYFSASSFAQSYNQGIATWPYQTDAKCYQVFYKESTATNWQFAVRCKDTKNPEWQYTIKYLKSGVSYTYRVKEVSNIDNGNKYRWITNEKVLQVTPQPQS